MRCVPSFIEDIMRVRRVYVPRNISLWGPTSWMWEVSAESVSQSSQILGGWWYGMIFYDYKCLWNGPRTLDNCGTIGKWICMVTSQKKCLAEKQFTRMTWPISQAKLESQNLDFRSIFHPNSTICSLRATEVSEVKGWGHSLAWKGRPEVKIGPKNGVFLIWLWINTYENTILVGWTSINPSYFDVNRRGTIGFDPYPYEKKLASYSLLAWVLNFDQ